MTTNNLDLLLIDTYSASTIGIADISIYATTYTPPTTLQIEITPPGFAKVTVDFNTKTANIYRSLDLGLTCTETCMDLPDGIYEVKYSTPAPKAATITKFFIKVDRIKNIYMNKFLSIDMECDCSTERNQKLKQELQKISMLIEGAIAAANQCDLVTSKSRYQKAELLLKQIKCH